MEDNTILSYDLATNKWKQLILTIHNSEILTELSRHPISRAPMTIRTLEEFNQVYGQPV